MKIKLGFIGLGQRGQGLLSNVLPNFPDVDVVAVCDVYEDRAKDTAARVEKERGVAPKYYTDHHELLKDENVNAVIISAAWEAHVPVAIDAMRAGKIVGLEVGGAYAVQDCWNLVKCYEETKTPLMFLENTCFGKMELLATGLARKGALGEICHCHGAYCHDLRKEISDGVKIRHYRLRNYLKRNCDNYPTHDLGPIAKLLDINRGVRMTSLVSLSSKARGLSEFVQDKEEYAFLKNEHFAQGDVVETLITCSDGTLISLKLSTTTPRFYSREFAVTGTRGVFDAPFKAVLTEDVEFNHESDPVEKIQGNAESDTFKKYLPKCWRDITKEEIEAGHGGMDTLTLRAFFEAAQNGEEMPIDVYDAASWMCITALTEDSIAMGGAPVAIPDFTSGAWVMRPRKDVVNFDE